MSVRLHKRIRECINTQTNRRKNTTQYAERTILACKEGQVLSIGALPLSKRKVLSSTRMTVTFTIDYPRKVCEDLAPL